MTRLILCAEDDEDDRELILIHFRRADLEAELQWAKNGVEALDYLHASLRGERVMPDLIIADLKMPKVNGLELLELVRENKLLADIPFVVLTSSGNEKDKADAARLGASLYLQKPTSVEGYLQVIEDIRRLLDARPTP